MGDGHRPGEDAALEELEESDKASHTITGLVIASGVYAPHLAWY